MAELNELYQQVILDHNKKPRNFKRLETANRRQEGYNPLCGDQITLYLEMDGDLIKDVGFQGSGCAISKASASMMTAAVKGDLDAETEQNHLGRLKIFAGVREFPARVKCASLSWHTLRAAIEGRDESITTEDEHRQD